jgi:antitoxin ParD1/3/4
MENAPSKAMTTTSMNVSLPDGLKEYVKERVAEGTYSTPSDFVRDLIRADMQRRGRQRLEQLLLEGVASGDAEEVTPEYLATLRREAEEIIAGNPQSGV